METKTQERSGRRVTTALLGLGRAVSTWSRVNQMSADEEARLSRHAGGRV